MKIVITDNNNGLNALKHLLHDKDKKIDRARKQGKALIKCKQDVEADLVKVNESLEAEKAICGALAKEQDEQNNALVLFFLGLSNGENPIDLIDKLGADLDIPMTPITDPLDEVESDIDGDDLKGCYLDTPSEEETSTTVEDSTESDSGEESSDDDAGNDEESDEALAEIGSIGNNLEGVNWRYINALTGEIVVSGNGSSMIIDNVYHGVNWATIIKGKFFYEFDLDASYCFTGFPNTLPEQFLLDGVPMATDSTIANANNLGVVTEGTHTITANGGYSIRDFRIETIVR
jgi:hypothetical protein